jgi:hypothetical protein
VFQGGERAFFLQIGIFTELKINVYL